MGAIELLGRYPYAPQWALMTASGLVYVHGLDLFSQPPDARHSDLNDLKAVLLAGFGALAFMRSSLFKVRVGDGDIGIGPAAVLDTLLLVADRGVDRQEALLRAQEVTSALRDTDPVKGVTLLVAYCLALMQNVSANEEKDIATQLQRISANKDYDPQIRLDLVALALSKFVGPNVLKAAIAALGDRLKSSGYALVSTGVSYANSLKRLRGADPAARANLLVAYSLAMSQNMSDIKKAEIVETVKNIASTTSDPEICLDLIALELSKRVGPTVLEAAMQSVCERLNPRAPQTVTTQEKLIEEIDKEKAARTSALKVEVATDTEAAAKAKGAE